MTLVNARAAFETAIKNAVTTADNTATLTLKSTDADASVGPILSLVRDSGSPADADFIGAVRFFADNDAGESIQFAEIDVSHTCCDFSKMATQA